MVSSIVNSLGYGSGLDVGKLVTDLAAASRDPKVKAFDTRAKANQASISAVGQARADLESFATSLGNLAAGGTLQSQPAVSDSAILDARAQPGARLGTLPGEIEVTQLARGQSTISAYVPRATDSIGQGTLTLTVGSTSYPVSVAAGNDSLNGLAAAINDARAGVTASVLTDASGARLLLKGSTGAASAFSLSGDGTALSRFTYPGGMTSVQNAQDAVFKVDGLQYSRPANSIDDVIPGVALTLKKAAAGVAVTMTASSAGDTLKATIGDFVSVFNTLKGHIAAARTATNGDNAMRTLDLQLSRIVGQRVTSGSPASLSGIGVRTNRDGTLAFDETAFKAAYATDAASVEAIFSPPRGSTNSTTTDPGIGGALAALKTAATATGGVIAGLSARLDSEAKGIADNRAQMETRETAYKARLDKQFGGLDVSVGALKATQSYLDQQVKVWTASR